MEQDNNIPLDQNTTIKAVAQQDMPGAGGILAMGIISIPFCMGLIGLILSILALTKANRARFTYNNNPEMYTEKSMRQINAGRVCAIVSLSLLGVGILLIIMLAAING